MNAAHIPRREVPYSRVLGAPLRALDALAYRVLDALSCYLSLILKHSDTKLDLKNSRLKLRGARACCAPPPLDPPLNTMFVINFYFILMEGRMGTVRADVQMKGF